MTSAELCNRTPLRIVRPCRHQMPDLDIGVQFAHDPSKTGPSVHDVLRHTVHDVLRQKCPLSHETQQRQAAGNAAKSDSAKGAGMPGRGTEWVHDPNRNHRRPRKSG